MNSVYIKCALAFALGAASFYLYTQYKPKKTVAPAAQ